MRRQRWKEGRHRREGREKKRYIDREKEKSEKEEKNKVIVEQLEGKGEGGGRECG